MPEKGKAERNVEERRMFLEIKTIQREKQRKKERKRERKRTMEEEGKESVSLSLSLYPKVQSNASILGEAE